MRSVWRRPVTKTFIDKFLVDICTKEIHVDQVAFICFLVL